MILEKIPSRDTFSRVLRFTRYADDYVIAVRSESSAERVMLCSYVEPPYAEWHVLVV